MPKLKIVIMAGGIPTTTFIDGMVNGMSERGYEMIILGRKEKNFSYENSVRTIEIPKSNLGRYWFLMKQLGILLVSKPKSFSKVALVFKRRISLALFLYDLSYYLPLLNANPDRIHIQWASFLQRLELIFELFPGKILLSLRGSHINYTPIINPEMAKVYRQLFPRVKKFHAVSEAISTEAQIYHASKDRISVIYSAINFQKIIGLEKTKENNFIPTFIVVGRNHWIKGYGYLFDALAILKTRGVAFRVKLFAVKLYDEYIYQIHQNKLSDHLILCDNVTHEKVLQEIKNSDALIISSVNEGIANVAIEAMALGVPVLSSNCGGMSEIIEHGINGFLFENRNATSMANSIEEFINLQWKNDLINKGLETVNTKFDFQRMLNEFEDFYRD